MYSIGRCIVHSRFPLCAAQEVDDATTDEITPLTLRPPEVILGGPWNENVDIWTFGCVVRAPLLLLHCVF